MRRVRLEDYGATRRQCRRGVAARDRKGQGEVRRTEHRYRAERREHPPHIRFGQGLPVGVGVVDAGVYPRALTDEAGEHTELPRGSGEFTL